MSDYYWVQSVGSKWEVKTGKKAKGKQLSTHRKKIQALKKAKGKARKNNAILKIRNTKGEIIDTMNYS